MKLSILLVVLFGSAMAHGRLLGTTSNAGTIMGGYSDIPNLSEKSVQTAAQFAVNALLNKNTTANYTFIPSLLQQQLQNNGTSGFKDVRWTLAQGQQAVVDGMN
jgi:hypothetical protein